jgi:alanyl-tRNA synthetase
VLDKVPTLLGSATRRGPVTVVAEDAGTLNSADDLRLLVTTVRERLGSDAATVALAARAAGKPVVIVGTNQAARDAGVNAGTLAKTAAGVLGGGGGGKADLAQGGGTDSDAIPAALTAVVSAIG